ncbi:MAG: hypothetical protein Q4B31_03115 [Clostridia bacterium]|nr:hypothetical protein [Clostridia bacterium]
MYEPIENLRITENDISGVDYSAEYINNHSDYFNTVDPLHTSSCSKGLRCAWYYEPIEVILKDGKILCHADISDIYYKEQQEEFITSKGVFVSHNHGEFGGELITPKGEKLRGNFTEVIECNNNIYAIDTCKHTSVGHTRIYSFSETLESTRLYSSDNIDEYDFPDKWIDVKGLLLTETSLYVLSSGRVDLCGTHDISKTVYKTYLFELRNGKLFKTREFDFLIERNVKNMLIYNNNLYIGMDKIVSVIDLSTNKRTIYTSISENAEKDLLKTIENHYYL